jgi:RNA polymerase sigma-70 factor (ECF subfamily)
MAIAFPARPAIPRHTVWHRLFSAPREDKQTSAGTHQQHQTFQTFEEFITGREADIFGYLWRMTGEEQMAYDLCQETFLRAWQQFGKIRAYEQPGAWLFRVATNLALNAIERRTTNAHRITLLHGESASAIEDASGRVAHRELIHETLLQLPARERAALLLREVEGFSNGEIANALDISANSVRMLLSRARAHFRHHYRRVDSDETQEESR